MIMERLRELQTQVENIISADISDNERRQKLRDLDQLQYKSLIQEYAYKKDQESYQALATVFKDLAYLVTNLSSLIVTDNGADVVKNLDTKIRYLTEATIFYQYAISIITEHIIPNERVMQLPDTNADNTDLQTQQWERKLDNIYTELGSIKQEILAISAGNSIIEVGTITASELKNEIIRLKAPLIALRLVTQQKSDTIEEYRLQSQSADIVDSGVKRELQSLYVNEAEKLFEHIATTLKSFLMQLYQEAEAELAAAGITKPCDYAVIGLGSLALNQATPYSDLEFAILLKHEGESKEEGDRIKEYFRNLTHIVHFKVINLGETTIPISKYGLDLDHLVHKGVNFDLGGKTPLGRIEGDKPYELIKTIEWMMHYVKNEEVDGKKPEHIDKNLPFILENVTHIHGSEELTRDYKIKVTKFLDSEVSLIINHQGEVVTTEAELLSSDAEPYIVDNYLGLSTPNFEETVSPTQTNFQVYKITMRQYKVRAIQILKEGVTEIDYININKSQQLRAHHTSGDLGKLRPDLSEAEGRLLEVKQEIYRLPDRMIYNLGLYYGVRGSSGWNIVDQLRDEKVINGDAAHNIKNAITFATTLRLKTYMHYKAQAEDMSIFAKPIETEDDITKKTTNIFRLSEDDLQENGALFQYFYTALPFHKRLEEFCNKHISLSPISIHKFFEGDIFYKVDTVNSGLIHYRLTQYQEARKQLEYAITAEQDISIQLDELLHIKYILGRIYHDFGLSDASIEQFEYCLEVYKSIYHSIPRPEIAAILNNVGGAYRAKGDFDSSISKYKEALSIQYQVYKGQSQNQDIAGSLHNLGNVYRAKGCYDEAIECYNQCLVIFESIYKDKPHISIAGTINSLGESFRLKGDYDKSIEYYIKSLEIYKTIFKGEPHLSVAGLLNNLGNAYEAKGSYHIAEQYFLSSLAIQKVIYKEEPHPFIASVLGNLGSLFEHMGSYTKAIAYLHQSLNIQKLIYKTAPHIDIAVSLNNLGNAYCAAGHYNEAVKYLNQALEVQETVYKTTTHIDTASTLINLGNVYEAKGKYKEALEYYKQGLNIQQDIYKTSSHSNIANTLLQIGDNYRAQNDHMNAEKFISQSLEILTDIDKLQDHQLIANAKSSLGKIYTLQSRYDEAMECFIESKNIQTRVFNGSHSSLATSIENIGIIHNLRGNYHEALKCFTEAIEMRRAVHHNAPHPEIAISLNNLATFYGSQGDYNNAKRCLNESIEICNKVHGGAAHPFTAVLLNNLGNLSCYTGSPIEGMKYLQSSLEMKKNIYHNQPHLDIANTLNNIAECYRIQGNYSAAITYNMDSLRMKQQTYQDIPHPDIADSFNNLGKVYRHLENYGEAIKCYTQGLNIRKSVYKEKPHPDIADSIQNIGHTYLGQGNYLDALRYYIQAYQVISNFATHPYSAQIKSGMLKAIEKFSNYYFLNPHNISQGISDCFVHHLDFTDYKMHYQIALAAQQKSIGMDLTTIIESYKLALIFISSEEQTMESAIYSAISTLTGASFKSVELWLNLSLNKFDIASIAALANSEDVDFNISIQGFTPIIQSIVRGNEYLVQVIIQAGVDINKPNQEGATPLYCSLGYYYNQPINLKIVEILLQNGADTSIPMNDGDTPMHMAYYRANIDAIKLLLHYGANPNTQNHDGKTPLHCLLEKADIAIEDKIKVIEEFLPKYNLALQDQEGKTVIDYAAEHYPEALSALLQDIPRNQVDIDQEFVVCAEDVDIALVEPYMLMGYFGLDYSNESIC